ncbi:homeodomain GLABROUS 2 [Striga asiatica]|uniref:Homeodomain GLABROUS 2 n=1 Tax=Striga asiatica TaxID=4170 RepID=A0A5A7PEP9_STRAF|nr:homeodomain GLABROUS 2 [Striga asiatica]
MVTSSGITTHSFCMRLKRTTASANRLCLTKAPIMVFHDTTFRSGIRSNKARTRPGSEERIPRDDGFFGHLVEHSTSPFEVVAFCVHVDERVAYVVVSTFETVAQDVRVALRAEVKIDEFGRGCNNRQHGDAIGPQPGFEHFTEMIDCFFRFTRFHVIRNGRIVKVQVFPIRMLVKEQSCLIGIFAFHVHVDK